MKTLTRLSMLTALAAAMIVGAPDSSSAQATSNTYVTRYAVKVHNPVRGGWIPSGLYTSRFQAENREQQLEREWWVIYHRGEGRRYFRSARSHYEAVELMHQLRDRGYCVFKKRKIARVFRVRKRVVYTVRDYNPLTGRLRSSRTFNNYSQARTYYLKLRKQYWVIVKPRTGRTRYIFGGTKAQATTKATVLSLPFGQRAFSKRRTARLSTRVMP